jgi:HEAT repeat protein
MPFSILARLLPGTLCLCLAASSPIASSAAAEPEPDRAAETQAENAEPDLDRLTQELKHEQPDSRRRALTDLAQCGAAALPVLPAITAALQDESPEVRASAAMALGRLALEPKTVLPKLIECFDDQAIVRADGEVGEVWYYAAIAAARYGDAAVPSLIELLKQDDSQQRIAASLTVCAMGPQAKDVLPALTEALRSSDLDTRRPALMNALLCLGREAKPAMPLMIEFLDDQDFHTQYWACRVLGAIGPEAKVAVPKLLPLVQTGVTSVRRNAAAALGKIGPDIGPQALQVLIRALNDPLQPVREEAAVALGRLGEFAQPAVPALEELLKDESSFAARSRGADALWRLNPKSPTPLRVLLVQVQSEEEAETAARVLGEIGNELGAADPLTGLLDSPQPRTRIHAAWALGLMGKNTERAIDVLKSFLDDPEPEYRDEAEVALSQIRERIDRSNP